MDDDLVLNIADSSAQAVRRTANVKGGRWTDRLKAKRVSKRKASSKGTRRVENNTSVAEVDESPRPAKKARRDSLNPIKNGQQKPTRPAKLAPPTRASQIISSLFTSNPSVKVTETHFESRRIVNPSNAPLTDKSTFTGLGLDPLIVNHLSSKMNITNPTSIQREALPPLLSSSSDDTSERDAFIQSQTGSGKTLSYLLPILQDLLPLSSLSYIDRSIGTLAIIIVPTRELAQQISSVLETLLQLRLRPPEENSVDADAEPAARLTRWLVSGLLIGGHTRSHEKARLRKGLPILVSTPGRLLDHLQNTESFNVGKCRWLVLDEADRLMELGFEEAIKGILQALDGRRKLALQAVQEGNSLEVGGWDWERRRRTVLCSATMKEDVQHLAGTTLVKPIIVKGTELSNLAEPVGSGSKSEVIPSPTESFTPPSQLSQKYVIAPLKLRLVTLVALLRSLLSQSQSRQGTKIIVFLSCTDSVDYHWRLLGSSSIEDSSNSDIESGSEGESYASDGGGEKENAPTKAEKMALSSSLLPETAIYRLHGSLALQQRLASLKGFAKKPSDSRATKPSILLCTSVASRGLDLPLVRAVVQYDLPTEGGATEYVHRVGRTARVGKGGEAWCLVSPSEEAWPKWIQERIQEKNSPEKKSSLVPVGMDTVLQNGFGGTGREFEERATQVQLSFERWVLKRKENGDLARKAFQSHLRAYATHPSDEKHMFHVRHLHTGHLAKAFALREAPSNMAIKGARTKLPSRSHRLSSKNYRLDQISQRKQPRGLDVEHDANAEKRMQDAVRKQGKLVKKGGLMMSSGTSDFQIAGGDELGELASQR